jgi:hypothetical protein
MDSPLRMLPAQCSLRRRRGRPQVGAESSTAHQGTRLSH